MLDGSKRRKRIAEILIAISIFQLSQYAFLVILAVIKSVDRAMDVALAGFLYCPQIAIMPVVSILVYLASPWVYIYYIYAVIWFSVFISGTLWMAIILDIFNVIDFVFKLFK